MTKNKVYLPCVLYFKKSKLCLVYACPVTYFWELKEAVPDLKVLGCGNQNFDKHGVTTCKINKLSSDVRDNDGKDWFRLANQLGDERYGNFVLVAIPEKYKNKNVKRKESDDEDDDGPPTFFQYLTLENGTQFHIKGHYNTEIILDKKILES